MAVGLHMHVSTAAVAATQSPVSTLAHAELVTAIGLFLVIAHALLVWLKLRGTWEPKMGQAVTRPTGLSAPTLRFIRTGRFDAASLTSAFLSLAAKGAFLVEHENKSVRLRKVADPLVALTRAENQFAERMMRLRSTLLINQNAGPTIALGAAALQIGVIDEWRRYQAGRLRGQFRWSMGLAVLVVVLALLVADEPLRFAVVAVITGIAIALIAHFLRQIVSALARLWHEPRAKIFTMVFNGGAALAAFGTTWVALTWNDGGTDMVASLLAGMTLAMPVLAHGAIASSRLTAGPLRGRLEALRNQLMSKAQGIDEIGNAALPDKDESAAGTVAQTLWIADAIALDAVNEPQSGPVAKLAMVFESPDRLAAALQAFVPVTPLDQFERMRRASSDS